MGHMAASTSSAFSSGRCQPHPRPHLPPIRLRAPGLSTSTFGVQHLWHPVYFLVCKGNVKFIEGRKKDLRRACHRAQLLPVSGTVPRPVSRPPATSWPRGKVGARRQGDDAAALQCLPHLMT